MAKRRTLVTAAVLVGAMIGRASASEIVSVTIDTSHFSVSGNPYQLDVNLIAANGTGDNSSVTLDNLSCTDCTAVSQTLSNSAFSQDMYINFTAGGSVAFDLTLSPDLSYLTADGPDSFQLSILDQFDNPMATTDPFYAVLFASFDSVSPTIDSFGSPVGSDTPFAAPLVVERQAAPETPEPDSAALMIASLGYLVIRNRYRQS